jgi:hypothetical protein
VSNFVNFVPLGTVLVALLGVGVAEKSGLLSAAIRAIVLGAPKNLVTAALVFAGVLSNTASEMGYVVIVPMGAAIFFSLGRHPLAGLAAAFAGVSGGYSANLLIGTVDPLLAGITEEAARMVDETYEVHPAVNWYFMIASVFLITAIGTFVTAKIVEPKLGRFDDSRAEEGVEKIISMEPLSTNEWRGLKWAAVRRLMAIVCVLRGTAFDHRSGRASESVTTTSQSDDRRMLNTLWHVELEAEIAETKRCAGDRAQISKRERGAPEPKRLETWYVPAKDDRQPPPARDSRTTACAQSGYGRSAALAVHARRGGHDLHVLHRPRLRLRPRCRHHEKRPRHHRRHGLSDEFDGLYIVLVFFAAQFVEYFGWTNLGLILAVVGAEAIAAMRLDNMFVFIPVHPDLLRRQPDAGQRERAMGGHRADLRADADARGLQPGSDPGRVPHRRFIHKHHHADDELLRHHLRLRLPI